MTITSNQNAVRNINVRLSNLQGNARLISGFSFQHTGTSIADVSVIISNASLDMSSSAVFFQMFFGNASNIVFQLHQVNVTGTLPLVSAFPSYSGIVSLQGPSVSNLNVVFSECSINLSAAPNFGLIWTNTTHILLAAQLRIISMVIQWEIDCRGARNERCGRQATATTFSDMISLSNINGALDAVTIVMDTLRFSVGQLTDVFSQSGFASSLIRICGTTTATAGRMSNSSVVVKSVTMVGHTTEMGSLIILAYFNGGVNDTNFSVVDVSADIKVAGDRPRLRGRISTLISLLLDLQLHRVRVAVENTTAVVFLTCEIDPSITTHFYCFDSVSTSDVLQLGAAFDSTAFISNVTLNTTFADGIMAGLQVKFLPYTYPIAIVSSCILRQPINSVNLTVILLSVRHIAVARNVSLGTPAAGQVNKTGTAGLVFTIVQVGANVSRFNLTIVDTLQVLFIHDNVFSDSTTLLYADVVNQTTLVTFTVACTACVLLQSSIPVPVPELQYVFPHEITDAADSNIAVLNTNFSIESALNVYENAVDLAAKFGTSMTASILYTPNEMANVSFRLIGLSIDAVNQRNFTVVASPKGSSVSDARLMIDSCRINSSENNNSLFVAPFPSSSTSNSTMMINVTLGCNAVAGVPFPSFSSMQLLPALVRQELMDSPNHSLSAAMRGYFRIDSESEGFKTKYSTCVDVTQVAVSHPPSVNVAPPTQVNSPESAALAFVGALDAPLLMGIFYSKCGGAAAGSVGQIFLSVFYKLGTVASVLGNLALLVLVVGGRFIALCSKGGNSGQSQGKRISLFHFVAVPLSQPLRFPNWDISGGAFLLQGTIFYSTRGITDMDGSSADVAAGVVGLIASFALCAVYVRLHLCSLRLRLFKFERYRQHSTKPFPSTTAWRYFVPKGRWGPQFIRLSLGALRSSATNFPRDNMTPVFCNMISQALMGLDLRENSSSAPCSGMFFVLSALRIGVTLLHVVYFSRGRSKGLAAAHVMQHASQAALLVAFACLMLEDTASRTDDGATFSAIRVLSYFVSVTSALRMVLLILTFVWESHQSASALESVENNLPMNLTVSKKKRRDSKIVSYEPLKNLIYEICDDRRSARHKLTSLLNSQLSLTPRVT